MPGGRNQCSPHPYIYPTTEETMHYSGCARLKTALPVFSCWKQQSSHCETVLRDSLSSPFFCLPLKPCCIMVIFIFCLSFLSSISLPSIKCICIIAHFCHTLPHLRWYYDNMRFCFYPCRRCLPFLCAWSCLAAHKEPFFLLSALWMLNFECCLTLFSFISCWYELSLGNIFMFPEPVVSWFSVTVHGWLWKTPDRLFV